MDKVSEAKKLILEKRVSINTLKKWTHLSKKEIAMVLQGIDKSERKLDIIHSYLERL